MLREITEITSGHTTNKYKGWDSKSSIRGLLQSHTFPTEQHKKNFREEHFLSPHPSKETEYINKNFLTNQQKVLTKNFLHDVNIGTSAICSQ